MNMMGRNTNITQEDVKRIKDYLEKYPMLKQSEIAKLCDVSSSTVGRVANGHYDEDGNVVYEKTDKSVINAISNVAEQQHQTRNALIESFGDATVQDLYDVMCKNNRLLKTIALILACDEDPSHVKSKQAVASFREEIVKNAVKS